MLLRPRTPLSATLCLGACLVGLAAAPRAEARVGWIVHGHGFGHGVGMSQYGAYGYAEHGKGYRFILAHYYRGTTLGKLARPRVVRVLVSVSGGDVGFSGATGACGRSLDPALSYAAHRAGGAVLLRSSSGRRLADCGRRLRAAGNGRIEIAGAGTYRGALEVVPTASSAGSLNAVDAVEVNQYVKGVIPNESPASWPLAALRAQAVASRSYALSDQVSGNGFDLYDTTSSQVYKGLGSETARTDRAANETAGQVLTYGGRIAQAFFFACSGGHTESAQNVFSGPPIPYLVGVPDPFDYYCPLHSWTLRFSGPQISARLGPHLKGQLERVAILRRGTSPRILLAKLVGTGGVTRISGDQLASALGAYTSWMTFRRVVDGKPSGGEEGGGGGPPGGAETG